MERTYHKSYSRILGRDMELLIFGHAGVPVIFFPTRSARFYDFENWKIIDALRPKIEAGLLQIYCVDSIDCESFYSQADPPLRILRHIKYEKYIIKELIPFCGEELKVLGVHPDGSMDLMCGGDEWTWPKEWIAGRAKS